MKRSTRYAILIAVALGVVGVALLAAWFLGTHNVAVLNPKGTVSEQQRNLIIIATLLVSLVVVPVFVLTFVISWKYRDTNGKGKYTPDWDHNKKLEFAWWAIPCAIIAVLGFVAWKSAHDLDPFKPLSSNVQPITIQVVAMQWKWLFVYPKQHIATVNFVEFPKDTPVNFEITSDAPMNSFWIPQLGGQIYAMSGMSTQLHVMASETGDYRGQSANISGEGYAGMVFTARAAEQNDFDSWVRTTQASSNTLAYDNSYSQLAAPSTNNPPAFYGLTDDGLYNKIIMKYMGPDGHGGMQ